MSLADKKVLVLTADLFEDMELLYPVYRLREEDVSVTVAGLDDNRSPAKGATARSRSMPLSRRSPSRSMTRWSFRAGSLPTSCASRRECWTW